MANSGFFYGKREYAPWSGETLRSAARRRIGQELKAHYQTPRDLPHSMLALLIQMDGQDGGKKSRRGKRVSRARPARRSGTPRNEVR